MNTLLLCLQLFLVEPVFSEHNPYLDELLYTDVVGPNREVRFCSTLQSKPRNEKSCRENLCFKLDEFIRRNGTDCLAFNSYLYDHWPEREQICKNAIDVISTCLLRTMSNNYMLPDTWKGIQKCRRMSPYDFYTCAAWLCHWFEQFSYWNFQFDCYEFEKYVNETWYFYPETCPSPRSAFKHCRSPFKLLYYPRRLTDNAWSEARIRVPLSENEEELFCQNMTPEEKGTCRGKGCIQLDKYMRDNGTNCLEFHHHLYEHWPEIETTCKWANAYKLCLIRTMSNNYNLPLTWRGISKCRKLTWEGMHTCEGRLCYEFERYVLDSSDCDRFEEYVKKSWRQYSQVCATRLSAMTYCQGPYSNYLPTVDNAKPDSLAFFHSAYPGYTVIQENEEEIFCNTRSSAENDTCSGKICTQMELYFRNNGSDCVSFYIHLKKNWPDFGLCNWAYHRCRLRTLSNNHKLPATWKGIHSCRNLTEESFKTCYGRICYEFERYTLTTLNPDCDFFRSYVLNVWGNFRRVCVDYDYPYDYCKSTYITQFLSLLPSTTQTPIITEAPKLPKPPPTKKNWVEKLVDVMYAVVGLQTGVDARG